MFKLYKRIKNLEARVWKIENPQGEVRSYYPKSFEDPRFLTKTYVFKYVDKNDKFIEVFLPDEHTGLYDMQDRVCGIRERDGNIFVIGNGKKYVLANGKWVVCG